MPLLQSLTSPQPFRELKKFWSSEIIATSGDDKEKQYDLFVMLKTLLSLASQAGKLLLLSFFSQHVSSCWMCPKCEWKQHEQQFICSRIARSLTMVLGGGSLHCAPLQDASSREGNLSCNLRFFLQCCTGCCLCFLTYSYDLLIFLFPIFLTHGFKEFLCMKKCSLFLCGQSL